MFLPSFIFFKGPITAIIEVSLCSYIFMIYRVHEGRSFFPFSDDKVSKFVFTVDGSDLSERAEQLLSFIA